MDSSAHPVIMNAYRHASILAIILVAVIVFGFEQTRETSFAPTYGAVPSMIAHAFGSIVGGNMSAATLRSLSQLVTALFLHGGVEHILFNMVFLWAFGYLVSQILGQWWALVVFFVCGICGNVLQVCLKLDSQVPIVGASGAISGFAGLYFGLALSWKLPWPDVWPLAHPIPPLQLAAFAVAGFIGDMYLLASHDQQIAYGAHIGGFLSGLAIAALVTTVYPTKSAYDRGELKAGTRRG
jgi:membrane associated rhomboid family serine protease